MTLGEWNWELDLFHDLTLGESLYSISVVSATKCCCLVHSRFGYCKLLKPRRKFNNLNQKHKWGHMTKKSVDEKKLSS